MVPRNFKLKKNDKRDFGKSRLGIIGPLVNFGKMAVFAPLKYRNYKNGPWAQILNTLHY